MWNLSYAHPARAPKGAATDWEFKSLAVPRINWDDILIFSLNLVSEMERAVLHKLRIFVMATENETDCQGALGL